MKPVEIEFLMRDKGVSEGMDKLGKDAVSLDKKVERSAKGIETRIKETKSLIKYAEDELRRMESMRTKVPSGMPYLELMANIESCTRALADDKAELRALEAQHDVTADSGRRLSMRLREMYDDMAKMRLAGQQLTPEYKQMEAEAALLADTIGDVQAQTRALAHDNAGLQGVISGVNGVAGAFSVGTGIMGVFASENENLTKIQTRVQSVMAISIGLQQVMNTLNKDSAFRLVTLTRIKNGFSAANTRVAVSLGISNVAAKALMATLTLGLSVAVGAAIILFEKWRSKQAQIKKEANEFNDAVADMVTETVPKFQKLSAEWNNLGDSLDEKEKFIRNNQDAFKQLGVEIETAADAENLFIGNKDAFIESIYLRARSAAAMELASEKYKEAISKMLEADAMADTKTKIVTDYSGNTYTYEVKNRKKERAKKKAAKAEADAGDYVEKSLGYSDELDALMVSAGFKTTGTLIEGSVAAIEKLISDKKKALGNIASREDYDIAVKEIEDYEKQLKAITGAKEEKKERETKDKEAESTRNNLAALELKVQQKIEDQALAIREEGYEKEREQALTNFKREKERIEKEERERLALIKKLRDAGEEVDPEEEQKVKAQALAQNVQAAQIYDNAVAGIDKKEDEDKAETLKKLLEPYRTFAQQRLDIEEKYQSDIKAMRDAGASEENVAIAEEAQQDALDALDAEMAQKDETFQALMSRLSSMALTQLEQALKDAEKALADSEATNGSDNAQTAALRARVRALQAEIKRAKAEQDLKAPDDLQKWNKTASAVKKCKSEVDDMIGSMDFLDDSTKQALQAASNIANGAIAMIDGIKMLGVGAAQSISAVEKASVILAIIGAAVQIITAIFSMASAAEEKHQQALAEIAASKIAFQREYNLLLLEQKLLLEDAASVFGEKQVLKAVNALEVYKESMRLFKEELAGSAPGMRLAEMFTNDAFGTYQKRLDDYEKGLGALNNMTVKTGHVKTGLFGWGKGRDVYTSLMDVYGVGEDGLVDEAGRLNVEMAKTILNTQTMSDDNKELLQSLIDLQEQADEALESLRDYLEETFGGLGDGIVDSLVNALQTGEDAWESFGEKGAEVLEGLGRQIVYSLFFADKFSKLQEQLEEIYDSGNSDEQIAQDAMKLVGDFYAGIGQDMDNAQEWMKMWQEEAAKNGFEVWKGDASQAGNSGAFQTMSQEQGTKLEGLFTSVQMRVGSIDDKLDNLGGGIFDACDKLAGIEENTGNTVKRLDQVIDYIKQVIRDGLKMK